MLFADLRRSPTPRCTFADDFCQRSRAHRRWSRGGLYLAASASPLHASPKRSFEKAARHRSPRFDSDLTSVPSHKTRRPTPRFSDMRVSKKASQERKRTKKIRQLLDRAADLIMEEDCAPLCLDPRGSGWRGPHTHTAIPSAITQSSPERDPPPQTCVTRPIPLNN